MNGDCHGKSGGGGGSCYPHAQCKGGDSDMFPGWLLREIDFRQLASADSSALERRREDAAKWIKQEVLLVRGMEAVHAYF